MRVTKPILSRDSGSWISCAWSDCERMAVELHKLRFHDHARGLPCTHPDAKHVWFAFCSETHRQYYGHSHRQLGQLPPGFKRSILLWPMFHVKHPRRRWWTCWPSGPGGGAGSPAAPIPP